MSRHYTEKSLHLVHKTRHSQWTAIMFVRQLSVHKSYCMWKDLSLVSGGFSTHWSETPAEGKDLKPAVVCVQGMIFSACLLENMPPGFFLLAWKISISSWSLSSCCEAHGCFCSYPVSTILIHKNCSTVVIQVSLSGQVVKYVFDIFN